MRNLVSVLLLIGACISCNYDDENPFGFTGSATAQKKGEAWKSNIRVTKNLPYNIGINITFTVLNKEGFQREHMSIVRVNTTLDTQKIYLTTVDDSHLKSDSVAVLYSTLIDDGDVVGDIYGIDTTSMNNYIQLTKIDQKKCEISGTFSVKLKLIRNDGDGPKPPDIIEFTNGQFESRIKKEWFD